MNPIVRTVRKSVFRTLCLVAIALAPALVNADELSDSIEAAAKAAGEAERAASQALAAARNATSETLAKEAVREALRAAEAAKAAADASSKALAAARAAAASFSSESTSTSTAATTQVAAAAEGTSPYAEHVKCAGSDCKIDLWITRGFRAFSQCQVCHGLDGNGSSFAPSLVDKLKEIDKARFLEVVTNGYKGQVGVMPGWKENPNVMKYLDNLYGYLKARSDGAVPAGKLKRYDR